MSNPEHALEQLREMLQPIMLRRTKASTLDGVPILTLTAKWVPCNTLLYEGMHSLCQAAWTVRVAWLIVCACVSMAR